LPKDNYFDGIDFDLIKPAFKLTNIMGWRFQFRLIYEATHGRDIRFVSWELRDFRAPDLLADSTGFELKIRNPINSDIGVTWICD